MMRIHEHAEAFARLINGDYSLWDIDTLLEIGSDMNQMSAMVALRQFVNHSLIPHLDYFLIQALKTEDVSRVNSSDYPHIARIGGQPVLEAGIIGFHEVVAANYSREIAARVETETADLDLAFPGDRKAGPINERFALAHTMAGDKTRDFEQMFEATKQKIITILTDRDAARVESHEKKQELEAAKKHNADIQEKIALISREIEEKGKIAAARNESRVGLAWVLGGLQIIAGGIIGSPVPVITGISNIINGYMQNATDKKVSSQEVANINRRVDSLASRTISESALEKEIKQLEQVIEDLTKSEAYQKHYGSAQKMEAVRKAYLAKYLLDFGQHNLEDVGELCEENGIPSVDAWIAQFDSRVGRVLTHFCFGSANSNDMSIILAEANALLAEEGDPARLVLKKLAEECIKGSIAEQYAHAAQVDKMYQANLIGFGTNLHEARAMVRRETDKQLVALIGYQQATEPALMEGQYSARGAGAISRVFAYWQHRHGDEVLDTSLLLDEQESPTFLPPKRVTAVPEGEQRLFVERVKRAQANGHAAAPEIGDDFLKVCAYEYILPKFPHDLASGTRIWSDHPQTLAMYPVINATINHFLRELHMRSLDHYREQIGERLDNLLAQTFIDFFGELGTLHITTPVVRAIAKELNDAKTRPELFARIFEKYTRIVGREATGSFGLFLKIYARNLEKMLEVVREDDRRKLLEQMDAVHELTQGKLKPDVIMPGSPAARTKARNDNHTSENTHWKGARR